MPAIPEEVIEQIRDAADIVSILGEELELKRTGTDYRAPCPFHGGTHRNFAVIPKKQMFYCFVCHEAGDVFTYYMKRHGFDYPTAVREVARKVGVVIPERSASGPDPREPLYSVLASAAEWYARYLRESPDARAARDYLDSRDFGVEAHPELGLGFAPMGGAILESLGKMGYAAGTLLEAGITVRRDDGKIKPRFWNRIVFPIHDLRGRVVGFGGRALGDAEPKYLNSPESAVFHKGGLLYNLHQAKHAIRKAERAILVEGYFDALRLVQVGVDEVVAPLGTSLTDGQAALLKRYTKHAIILYDSDSAGLRATFRAADVLLRAPLRVSVATLPEGQDPDSLAASGGERGARELRGLIGASIDVLERKIQLIGLKGWLKDLSGRRRSLDRLLNTLRAAADPVTRDLYVSRVAEVLQVSADSVQREVAAGARGRRAAPVTESAPHGTAGGPERQPQRAAGWAPERTLVRVMVREPDWRSRIAEQVPDPAVLRQPERDLFERLGALGAGSPATDLIPYLDGAAQSLLGEILAAPWGSMDLDAEVTAAVNRLEARPLENELLEIERKIPLAADREKESLMKRKDTLSRQIAKLFPGRWPVIRKGRSSAV